MTRLILLLALMAPLTAEAKGAFGLGLELGSPSSFTGKYLFNPDQGVAFHVGAYLHDHYQHLRVQYEQRFVDFAKWRWGDLGMYFDVGGAVIAWDSHNATGPCGGVGVDMRFRKFPLIVFAELNARLYLVGDLKEHHVDGLGFYDGVGARWYF
ncbi:hypothetical protein KKF91_06425 [Myxococcota bacterium]|nr:hypothetical protein [Myxococcota bacterium]MBU1430189.1 hypothetical protein [Myxococcota bacterium]MBU1897065.1 hypothetical protein [Myxococcota bacterium]